MAPTIEQKLKADIATAERILSDTFGGKVQLELGDDEGLGRSYVHRLKISHGPTEAPGTVILKQGGGAAYDPDSLKGTAPGLFNEWAGLQFLTEVCEEPLPAPRFYGGERTAGFVLMEDFGAGTRLDHALRGEDAAVAEKTMIALFETVGRMHAQTIGKQSRYDEIRTALGPTLKPIHISRGFSRKTVEQVRQSLKAIGIKPQRGFYAEFETVRKSLNESHPFKAYIHSDPCPDNCHWVGSDVRLLDFDHGRFANALLDGVYPRIHFPTCWCVNRIPEAISLKAEAAYRAELVKGCTKAADDGLFYSTVVEVCAFWVFQTFSSWTMPEILEKDREWGIATVRQRHLLRFDLLAKTTEAFGRLEAIGATSREVLAKLRTLWPDVEEMPYYPAFR